MIIIQTCYKISNNKNKEQEEQQQVVENNVNQSEPNQNSAQGIEPNEAIISAEKPHTSFWSNRNNQ